MVGVSSDVCQIPSCRWRGTDHEGRCREVEGELEIGPDRGVHAKPAEPIHVAEFEGEYARIMEGNLPAINLAMDEGYARGSILDLRVQVRVRKVHYDEATAKDVKGQLVRKHIFALEEIQLAGAHQPIDVPYEGDLGGPGVLLEGEDDPNAVGF